MTASFFLLSYDLFFSSFRHFFDNAGVAFQIGMREETGGAHFHDEIRELGEFQIIDIFADMTDAPVLLPIGQQLITAV